MKILYLGKKSPIIEFLAHEGHRVNVCEEDVQYMCCSEFNWLISYGYKHIIKQKTLDELGPGKSINLHISLLPWNRGADPNLWSWIDNTPKGVTIHLIDEGIDTGPVLSQRCLNIPRSYTLKESYDKLSRSMERLFMDMWPHLKAGTMMAFKQKIDKGSYHEKKDRPDLPLGWDTPVRNLRGYKR